MQIGMDDHTLLAIDLFRRQYLQMVEPDQMAIPTSNVIKLPEVQSALFRNIFEEDCLPHAPSDRYKLRVLRTLVGTIEKAIEDPEEDVCLPCLAFFLKFMFIEEAFSIMFSCMLSFYILIYSFENAVGDIRRPYGLLGRSHVQVPGVREYSSAAKVLCYLYDASTYI